MRLSRSKNHAIKSTDTEGTTWAAVDKAINEAMGNLEVAVGFNDTQNWRKAILMIDKARATLAKAVVDLERRASKDDDARAAGEL